MKESKSETNPSKEKNKGSFLNSAKKVLNTLDMDLENQDKDSENHKDPETDDSKNLKCTPLDKEHKECNNYLNEEPEDNGESSLKLTSETAGLEDGDEKTIKSKPSNNLQNSEIRGSDAEDPDGKDTSEISGRFTKFKIFIREDRQRLITLIGLGVGIILILLGISFLFGTSDKVSDNVVFGERSVSSAFFIIIGLLIIAGVYAPKIIGKTSFDGIYQEMKGVENTKSSNDSSDSKKTSKKDPAKSKDEVKAENSNKRNSKDYDDKTSENEEND